MKNFGTRDPDNSEFALDLRFKAYREIVKKLIDPQDFDLVTALKDFDYFPDLEEDQEDLDYFDDLEDSEGIEDL